MPYSGCSALHGVNPNKSQFPSDTHTYLSCQELRKIFAYELSGWSQIALLYFPCTFSLQFFEYWEHLQVYSEPSETSKMKPFAKIVVSWWLVNIIAKISILVVWMSPEYASAFMWVMNILDLLLRSSSEEYDDRKTSRYRKYKDENRIFEDKHGDRRRDRYKTERDHKYRWYFRLGCNSDALFFWKEQAFLEQKFCCRYWSYKRDFR